MMELDPNAMTAVFDFSERTVSTSCRQAKVTLIGVNGLGSPLAQHLALLGVGSVTLVDDEELDETNRNRFIGARH